MKRIVLFIFAIFWMTSCGRYFTPDRNLTESLSEREIIGVWILTSDSVEALKERYSRVFPDREYSIALKEGGACVFSSLIVTPPSALSGKEPWPPFDEHRALEEAPCTWKLEHNTHGGSNVIKKNALLLEVQQPEVQDSRSYLWLNFTQDEGRLLMWEFLGDPDIWSFLEYERAGQN